MSNLHHIILQIQRELVCPICGRNYEIGELKIKGLYDRSLVIQTVCEKGHLAIFMTTVDKKFSAEKTLNADDLLRLHETLKDFNGDFGKLWKQSP